MNDIRTIGLLLALSVVLCWPAGEAWAGQAKADADFRLAMEQFVQKKYMSALRLYARSMSHLSPGDNPDHRARSMFYIGMCYYQTKKHRAHAMGAWRQFLKIVKKVRQPSATEWTSKLRIVREAMRQPAPQTAPDPGGEPGAEPPKHRQVTHTPPPPRRREATPPATDHPDPDAKFHKEPKTPLWLAELRRCLKVREQTREAALRRLKMCRQRMPRASDCSNRCVTIKRKIDAKIQQLGDSPDRRSPHGSDWLEGEGSNPPADGRTDKQPPKRPHNPGAGMVMAGTVMTIGGAVLGGLGVVGWLYAGNLNEELDSDLRTLKPSAQNTSSVVSKHETATVIGALSLVGLISGSVLLVVGSTLVTTGRRQARWSRRYASFQKTSSPKTPVARHAQGRTTFFSVGGAP